MGNFKLNFLEKLKELDKLKLPKGSFAITGSGPLAIRNIREAQDIDIMVKKNLWDELCKKYTPYDEKHMKIGYIEIWKDFINLTPKMNEIIDTAEIIEGYPFVSLKDTLLWKEFLNRKKDKKDILKIRNLVKT
ncbi:MAG: hypothetical protein K940chlam4_00911 [Candidatus Anoxychlamydiales bacterium]|nr:hypothetical protein [Candidatus Anoxychlamydiales bacterium]